MATAQDPSRPSSPSSSQPSTRVPPAIAPDDKNWTWVLERICPDCGYDATAISVGAVPELVRANVRDWLELLTHPHAALRPTADQWSAIEYACHVRDVFRLFEYRLGLMLGEDGPRFANWDQDETAIADRYDLQDAATVAVELAEAGASIADAFDAVRADQYGRTGFRSDGAAFTVETFARYFIHDPIHHVDDVHRGNRILADGELD